MKVFKARIALLLVFGLLFLSGGISVKLALSGKFNLLAQYLQGNFKVVQENGRNYLVNPNSQKFYMRGVVYPYRPDVYKRDGSVQVIEDLNSIKSLGFNTIGILGVNNLQTQDIWKDVLQWADDNEVGIIAYLSPYPTETYCNLNDSNQFITETYNTSWLPAIQAAKDYHSLIAYSVEVRPLKFKCYNTKDSEIQADFISWLKNKYQNDFPAFISAWTKNADNQPATDDPHYNDLTNLLKYNSDPTGDYFSQIKLADYLYYSQPDSSSIFPATTAPYLYDIMQYGNKFYTDFASKVVARIKSDDSNHLVAAMVENPVTDDDFFFLKRLSNTNIDLIQLNNFRSDSDAIALSKTFSDILNKPVYIGKYGFRTYDLISDNNQLTPVSLPYCKSMPGLDLEIAGKMCQPSDIPAAYATTAGLLRSLPWINGDVYYSYFDIPVYGGGDWGIKTIAGQEKPIIEIVKKINQLTGNLNPEAEPAVYVYLPEYTYPWQDANFDHNGLALVLMSRFIDEFKKANLIKTIPSINGETYTPFKFTDTLVPIQSSTKPVILAGRNLFLLSEKDRNTLSNRFVITYGEIGYWDEKMKTVFEEDGTTANVYYLKQVDITPTASQKSVSGQETIILDDNVTAKGTLRNRKENVEIPSGGESLAEFQIEDANYPAIIRKGNHISFLFTPFYFSPDFYNWINPSPIPGRNFTFWKNINENRYFLAKALATIYNTAPASLSLDTNLVGRDIFTLGFKSPYLLVEQKGDEYEIKVCPNGDYCNVASTTTSGGEGGEGGGGGSNPGIQPPGEGAPIIGLPNTGANILIIVGIALILFGIALAIRDYMRLPKHSRNVTPPPPPTPTI